MRNAKKAIAGILALPLLSGLTACEDTSGGNVGEATTASAASASDIVTVAINTEGLKDGEQEVIENAMAKLPDVELENKTVKWLAQYDLNPYENGASKSVALEMFEQKYGGKVEYYPCTWDDRFDKLSMYVSGGEGIDCFPGDDIYNFPKGIVNGGGKFQPVDDYIDIDNEIWQNVRQGMELYSFGGKHFNMVTSIAAQEVCVYNKQTIEENGLDDPWELYKEGRWNWNTFKDMLMDYVDEEYEHYGLDGYWAENALYLSTGVPLIGTTEDGHLVCNINDPMLEKAMDFQYELYRNGLVLDRMRLFSSNPEKPNNDEHPEMMGDGRELFYIVGEYSVTGAPETWPHKIDPENVGFVPVPSPEGSLPYQTAKLNGFALCKGAQNPEGVARLAECTVVASTDEGAMAISDRKTRDDSGLSDELIANIKEINELARQYPVVDLSSGASAEIASLTTQAGDDNGTRAAMHGKEWAVTREELAYSLLLLVDEADAKLQAKIAEWEQEQ